MSSPSRARWVRRLVASAAALTAIAVLTPRLCGCAVDAWFRGDRATQRRLADHLVAFEARDDRVRAQTSTQAHANRFAGEWALVTHQMTALGLGQVVLAHPELKVRYLSTIARAAEKSFLPEMRDFGRRAWRGEDVMASLAGDHGHAYMGYPALAVGMARLLGARLPGHLVQQHDRLIAAFVRRLSRSTTGLIETYPHEAYPTDVAAVVGAIALHGRATKRDYQGLLARWAEAVRRSQIDPASGFVHQRMNAQSGTPRDAPRGSGTGLAAYFAGFADGRIREQLARAVIAHESTFCGFAGIREYAQGHRGGGDIDSGPVVLGVSVAATGFALSVARTPARRETFERLFRTVTLFGIPASRGNRAFFASGGPIGNALLLAMLTSGPEVARWK